MTTHTDIHCKQLLCDSPTEKNPDFSPAYTNITAGIYIVNENGSAVTASGFKLAIANNCSFSSSNISSLHYISVYSTKNICLPINVSSQHAILEAAGANNEKK